ncbi:MAG: ribonuclease H-like domain-containing protein [Anaerolineales bacterium]|nr:ribonuclease H-like domain-containing protein [Anaerolineales bacterium]
MSSLADRLKALGVQIGASELKRKPAEAVPIESIAQGELRETDFGPAYVIEQLLPAEEPYGQTPLRFPADLEKVAAWTQDTRVALLPAERFVFLDTESTGVWGSGTLAFLVGIGRFTEGGFQQTQFFLREPIEERAMLDAVNRTISNEDALVTFNGKSFDIPLLRARYLTNSSPHPFGQLPHVDLLHLARRLWRELLPSRALGDLEASLLGVQRGEEEVPGWMVPQIYIDYLRSGDARPLAGVLYHNSMDVLSLAALLEHLANKLAAPLEASEHHSELHAIGRLYADTGFADEAIDVFQNTLAMDVPAESKHRLQQNLALLFRRRGDYEAALQLWEQAAAEGYVYAHVEIAKYYEHRAGDVRLALQYTQQAITLVGNGAPQHEQAYWEPLLVHRLARLERKMAKFSNQ